MFEEKLQQAIFSQSSEKTFIDKLLAKDDIAAIREIIKKDKLKREDFLEILYLLSSSEIKLLNLSAHERYIMMKFFVWIREFVKMAELIYDYQDNMQNENICRNCDGFFKEDINNPDKKLKKCKCDNPKSFILSRRAKKYFGNIVRLIEHNIKFLVDLYFNIGRSSLSLGGTGFMEILKNKYEVKYENVQSPYQAENKSMIKIKA